MSKKFYYVEHAVDLVDGGYIEGPIAEFGKEPDKLVEDYLNDYGPFDIGEEVVVYELVPVHRYKIIHGFKKVL